MRANPTEHEAYRRIIEKPQHDPAFEDTELHGLHSSETADVYDYFPDFGI